MASSLLASYSVSQLATDMEFRALNAILDFRVLGEAKSLRMVVEGS